MRRPRHVSPEERALWDMVARRSVPLDPKKSKPAPDEKPPKPAKPQPRDSFPEFRVGQAAHQNRPHDLVAPISHRLTAAPVQMDNKTHVKMKRGKLSPEARIDLHGMTVAEAHPELVAFILGSQSLDRRLVLVITGKGKDRDDGGPIPVRHGVLRHQVPQWMGLPPLKQAILQIMPAHLKHGGHGAYYVYLRRRR